MLLNHSEKAKIEILTTNPYTFYITNNKGLKYYFGQNSAIEYSRYNYENACDIEGPPLNDIVVAWFLTKITSPNADELLFNYQNLSLEYIYDYNESFTYRNLMDGWMGHVACPMEDGYNYGSVANFNSCYRSLFSSTKCLTSVVGTDFTVSFSYINRQDIQQKKLLEEISVHNSLGQSVEDIIFNYSTVGSLSTQIGFEGLGVRYFLRDLDLVNGLINLRIMNLKNSLPDFPNHKILQGIIIMPIIQVSVNR